MKIARLYAQEILDSCGFPTISCTIDTSDGGSVRASVPAGTSRGSFEACEKRDDDPKRYGGKGVLKAVSGINEIIAPQLAGKQLVSKEIDAVLLALDGQSDKSHLGANALLAVSIAVIRAEALAARVPLWHLIAQKLDVTPKMPRAIYNILNGGKHADNNLSMQEFSIVPQKVKSFAQSMLIAFDVYQSLGYLLRLEGLGSSLGYENGYAPHFLPDDELPERYALSLLEKATTRAGYSTSAVSIYVDAAATTFYDADHGRYVINRQPFDSAELEDLYNELVDQYPIIGLEDPFAEQDEVSWQRCAARIAQNVLLVGDDLCVTQVLRIAHAAREKLCSGVIIKPNQVGTVTETLDAVVEARSRGFEVVVSHRSGETNDDFIADLAVGVAAEYIKAGAPAGGERVAKYNRLKAIEEELPL